VNRTARADRSPRQEAPDPWSLVLAGLGEGRAERTCWRPRGTTLASRVCELDQGLTVYQPQANEHRGARRSLNKLDGDDRMGLGSSHDKEARSGVLRPAPGGAGGAGPGHGLVAPDPLGSPVTPDERALAAADVALSRLERLTLDELEGLTAAQLRIFDEVIEDPGRRYSARHARAIYRLEELGLVVTSPGAPTRVWPAVDEEDVQSARQHILQHPVLSPAVQHRLVVKHRESLLHHRPAPQSPVEGTDSVPPWSPTGRDIFMS
jgi:hypothetical protein